MASDSFDALAWLNALTLLERTASLHIAPHRRPPSKVAKDRGERRLQLWRMQRSMRNGSLFARRLTHDGLDEAKLLRLLSEPVEELAARMTSRPTWMHGVAESARAPSFEVGGAISALGQAIGSDTIEWPTFIAPWLQRAQNLLRNGLSELPVQNTDLPIEVSKAHALFIPGLARRLGEMVQRTLVLELNVTRLREELEGECPETRFQSFAARIGRRDIRLELFREYPVLARQLSEAVDSWLSCTLEFVGRLYSDWPTIREMFSRSQNPGLLIKVETDVGDRHRGGRSVAILTFASGLQIVYKPRSLAADLHFAALIEWLNSRGMEPPLRAVRTCDRGSYGWSEFISRHPCDSVDAVRRFYQRQGSYLAILYVLHATDFHYENIIAAGEYPMLVDLECLFTPELVNAGGLTFSDSANALLRQSVLRIRMLPTRSWTADTSPGIDFSSLGASELQMSPRPMQFWEAAGTDLMRMDRKTHFLETSGNRPLLDGLDIDVTKFQIDITAGFENTYRMFSQNRADLGAANGPLAAFHDDEVRVILRPTHLYDVLRRESYHPDVLRDALDRDRFFDRLWDNIEQLPHLASIISSERRDLWSDDIPHFTSRPSSSELSTGSEVIAQFFAQPGMSLVLERVEALSESDLERQRWLIAASFTASAVGRIDARMPSYTHETPDRSATSADFLDAAISVGDRLADLAIWDRVGASWIGLRPVQDRERYWNLSSLGLDLYSGLPGVAIFLSRLDELTGNSRYGKLASAAMRTLFGRMENDLSTLATIGALSGWGGLIYALSHLEHRCDENEFQKWSSYLVGHLPERIERELRFDIMSGSAGCLAALLTRWRSSPDDSTLDVAIQCGDHLVKGAKKMKSGIGWLTPLSAVPLAGFSHGAAGIAWALSALSDATELSRFRNVAIDALEYERSLYSPDTGNWLDLREDSAQDISAWCHGAVGVGIGRIAMLPFLDTPLIRTEIKIAVEKSLVDGFGRNHCLCHGELGDLDFLILARTAGLLSQESGALVDRLATGVLDAIKIHGRLCGVPMGVETPGLMTGLAGIGYGLLRLAQPASVPSVLALEPPRQVSVPQNRSTIS